MSTPPSRWALGPKFHVGVTFMIQFVVLLALLGGVLPTLHSQGYSWALLVPAALAVLVVVHYAISFIARRIPVRCRQCRSRSYFRGFGWWPFIYKFNCADCGTEMRYEVSGG